MTTTGPASFDQPTRILSSILDGITMHGDFRSIREVMPGPAIHHFPKANGAVGIQVPMVGADRSSNPQRYTWAFEQQIGRESEVRLIDRLAASGAVAFFVPYDVVAESFPLATGTNNLRLARHEASVEASFPGSPRFPHKAWIDGTEQTVVTGTPGAGEVQLNGTTVSVVGATGGEALEVRYYPAYSVFAVAGPWTHNDDKDQVRSVQILEAGT